MCGGIIAGALGEGRPKGASAQHARLVASLAAVEAACRDLSLCLAAERHGAVERPDQKAPDCPACAQNSSWRRAQENFHELRRVIHPCGKAEVPGLKLPHDQRQFPPRRSGDH